MHFTNIYNITLKNYNHEKISEGKKQKCNTSYLDVKKSKILKLKEKEKKVKSKKKETETNK